MDIHFALGDEFPLSCLQDLRRRYFYLSEDLLESLDCGWKFSLFKGVCRVLNFRLSVVLASKSGQFQKITTAT